MFISSFRKAPFLHSHRYANARKSTHSVRSFVPITLHSRTGQMSFPTLKSCGCCIASLHSAKHRHPTHSALTVHSANSTPHTHSIHALAFSNAPVPQKNAPALPYRLTASTLRAISVSGTRSSRIGSPTTHRLHTLSFRRLHFNRIRLAIHRTLRAVSPKFGLNASPTPTPDRPTITKYRFGIYGTNGLWKSAFHRV